MMGPINTEATVSADGTLRIELPSSGLPAGKLKATVTLEPISESEPRPGRACSGLFLGKLPPDFDIDAALREIRHEWEEEIDP